MPDGALRGDPGAKSERDDAAQALPLRAIEWSELTAKLSAARDLRELVRKDVGSRLGDGAGGKNFGFADAAAQFFGQNEEDERGVNPNALDARKASSGMYRNVTSALGNQPLDADQKVTDSRAIASCDPDDAKEE